MKDTAKAAENEITRKFYGNDASTHGKALKSGSAAAPVIKSFIELHDGQLVDEEIVEELVATVKVTAEVLTAARQILAGGA